MTEVPTQFTGMRVGFDLRRMHRTGIGRYARNIFAAVAAEAPGSDFVAVVQDERDAEWVRATAPRARWVVDPAPQYSPREMLRVPRLGTTVDVFHSPHPYHLGFGGRHRTVLTLLDLIQLTHAIGARNVVAREPLHAIMWAACARADGFVAISSATADAFARRMGVPRDRIRVTPLAADPRFAEPAGAAALAASRARWRFGSRVVLYVGMSQPHKNLDRLLQAVSMMVRERPADPIQLAIVGPVVPAERAALLARVAALGVAERMLFLDWLSDDDVRLAYHAVQVVALPSLTEGFGLTLLEAMQCGTPCVASDLPVLREVAGDAAEFVDPLRPAAIAAGLRAVLDDPARAAALTALGRANVARFSWRIAARETLAAYAAALR